MARHFEKVFIQHLTIPESMAQIVELDLPEDLLPTDELGAIFRFSIDYWHATNSRLVAPTPEVLRSHSALSNALAEHEIDLDIEPEGTLEWALDMARGAYIDRAVQPWVRSFATEVASPDIDYLAKPAQLDTAIQDLMELQARFAKRTEQVDVRFEMAHHLTDYHLRAANQSDTGIRGALIGMREIDQHTGGIRDGELAVVAAGPKTGKSFCLLWGAWMYYLMGGTPTLFSLENSVEMTLNRLACMVNNIDSRRWDMGLCTEAEVEKITLWVEDLRTMQRPFHIIQPEPGKRTVESMVRRARTLGDAMYADQLTFFEPSRGTERRSKTEQIGIMLHEMKSMLGTGKRMPGVVAHQINREGIKAAEKTGHLEMYHMAESAEVERTIDWGFGIYQGAALRDAGHALFQTLASRRADLLNWQLNWQPFKGELRVRSVVTLDRGT